MEVPDLSQTSKRFTVTVFGLGDAPFTVYEHTSELQSAPQVNMFSFKNKDKKEILIFNPASVVAVEE